MPTDSKPLYQHHGAALLRAAAVPLNDAPDQWCDPADTEACRAWLHEVWSRPGISDAIRLASPALANRADAICGGQPVDDRHVRRATASVTRYALRGAGRPTPFGLFAGIGRVSLGPASAVTFGAGHQALARVDTEWLADVITRLEACPELLERLEVTFTDLAVKRGGRLEAPQGPNRVTIPASRPVLAVREAASRPLRFEALADKLTADFPGVNRPQVVGMLTELVRQGFLLTELRAPFTITDVLTHCIDRLRQVGAYTLPVAKVLAGLEQVGTGLSRHNRETPPDELAAARTAIICRMRDLSDAGRTPLAVDLLLDYDVQLPVEVAREGERAANVLLRLTRQPTGQAEWRDYHAAFVDAYGTGTLVPVRDVVHPDAGLGYPATYPGSVHPAPVDVPTGRDQQLLVLAWQAIADGSGEILLTDDRLTELTDGDRFDARRIPPHVELAVRVHAPHLAALDDGAFTLTVAPARAAGTLTSRFTPLASGTGLEDLYRHLPAANDGALQVQMSFAPVYPHAENICRIPPYLPTLLPLGEHHDTTAALVTVDDLAITATPDRLHLVSLSRRQVVEPQVLHALALEKQPPPLARFLAHLVRGFGPRWHEFDWGPHARRLPYLPRLRYGRTVISPARWRLTTNDLPDTPAPGEEWRGSLARWRDRWHCPVVVELRDADRTLRLALDEPAHAAILHTHLARHGEALLTDAATADDFGWIGGHTHEIAFPLVRSGPPAPAPAHPVRTAPVVTNARNGRLPGATTNEWLYAKVFTHPERQGEIIAEYLPRLLTMLDEPVWWFVRYRSRHETDHLRLRIHAPARHTWAAVAEVVAEWAQHLRGRDIAGRLVLDTYVPETGRYGHGPALAAAEAVFAADSHAVATAMRHAPATHTHPTALAAVSMLDISSAFLDGLPGTLDWLISRPAPEGAAVDRAVADQANALARRGLLRGLPDWPGPLTAAWQARATALATYRRQLPPGTDPGPVLESLLHMHHNRALGIDRDSEHACRRLARQAALARRAQRQEDSR